MAVDHVDDNLPCQVVKHWPLLVIVVPSVQSIFYVRSYLISLTVKFSL